MPESSTEEWEEPMIARKMIMNTDGYGVYIEHADEVNISMTTTDDLYRSHLTYVSSDYANIPTSTNDWQFSCSTAVPIRNWTEGPKIRNLYPKATIKLEWCQWCGAEFYPHPYYQGNCVNCGGPKHWERDYR